MAFIWKQKTDVKEDRYNPKRVVELIQELSDKEKTVFVFDGVKYFREIFLNTEWVAITLIGEFGEQLEVFRSSTRYEYQRDTKIHQVIEQLWVHEGVWMDVIVDKLESLIAHKEDKKVEEARKVEQELQSLKDKFTKQFGG